jgi:hypothetical protein
LCHVSRDLGHIVLLELPLVNSLIICFRNAQICIPKNKKIFETALSHFYRYTYDIQKYGHISARIDSCWNQLEESRTLLQSLAVGRSPLLCASLIFSQETSCFVSCQQELTNYFVMRSPLSCFSDFAPKLTSCFFVSCCHVSRNTSHKLFCVWPFLGEPS